jgi:hypothetical protein
MVLGHIGDLAHNLDFERSIFSGPGRASPLDGSPKNSLHGVALSRLGERRLSPERAIIFVLRSRKRLLLVLRLRSVLHTLVGMVMRMLV